MTVTVRIDNTYEDGHESTDTVEVEAPSGDLDDDWWENVVWPHTGDGHGVNLNACYTATIIAGPAGHVGKTYEWA